MNKSIIMGSMSRLQKLRVSVSNCADELNGRFTHVYASLVMLLMWAPDVDRWGLWPPLAFLLFCDVWWNFFPVYAGYAVSALAFAAVIMTVRADQLKTFEKVLWVVVGTVLLIAEFKVIYTERVVSNSEQADERLRQQIRFDTTAKSFNEVLAENTAIMKRVVHADLIAEDSLASITGGHAYAYVVPQTLNHHASAAMSLENGGDRMLMGVTVRISLVTKDCTPIEEQRGCQIMSDDGLMRPVTMGTLGPHERVEMPAIMNIEANHNEAHYIIKVTAQNGTDLEDLHFKPSIDGQGEAYTFTVYTGKRLASSKTLDQVRKIKPTKFVDWTEPLRLPD